MNDITILDICCSNPFWETGAGIEPSNVYVISIAIGINGAFFLDNSEHAAPWMDKMLSFHVGQLNVYD